jgi:dienelactone hydrolase
MPHEIATRRVLYEIAGMNDVHPREFAFAGADGDDLAAALYMPGAETPPVPIAILVEGYADPGFSKFLGCRFMDMQWSVSMAQLLAASGIAAVTYTNRQPAADLLAIIAHVIDNARDLGVDASRIGLWATSGHGPVAISGLSHVRCAVLTNPFTFDIAQATHVADAARMFKFEAPSTAEIPEGKPLFVVRSGSDEMPGLNASLDRFISTAMASDRPFTLVNYAGAPHAFELFRNSLETRQILQCALTFLRAQLWA